MTYGEAQTLVRLLTQQVDTTAETLDLSTAHLKIHIQNAYRWMFDNVEKRVADVLLKTTMGANSVIVTPETTFIYPEVLEVYLVGTNTTTSVADVETPLQPMAWTELRNRQRNDTTAGVPTHYAIRRIGGAAPSGTGQNLWELAVYPIPSSGYTVRAIVRNYPAALGDDNSTVFLGDFEANCMCVLAAIMALPGSARQDLMDGLMWFFPEAMRAKVMAHASHEEILN